MPLLVCILIGIATAPLFSLKPFMAVAGGIFLLFAGCEINLREMRAEGPLIWKLWVGAFFPPFIAGAAVPFLFPQFFSPPVSLAKTAFILGIALSVSAVPVIIKVMQELGWMGTLRAQRVVFTAVLCDIAAWLLFFFVLPSEGQASWFLTHWSLLMFFVGLALVYFWPTFPQRFRLAFKLNQWIVAPVFFIGIGQALDWRLGINLPQIVLIFVVATVSKTAGVWLMAKWQKLPREELLPISMALNARGAMEIIMARFALSAGIIANDFFISLVIMALGTSLIIKPIIRWRVGPLFASNLR